MLSLSFFLLNALNFILIAVALYLGSKLLFKSTSPLNGGESIIIALLIFVAAFLHFMGGIEADQSHHYLEYQNIVEDRAERNFNSPNLYDYYSLDTVLLKTFGAIFIIAGATFYSSSKSKKRYLANRVHLDGVEHQGWQDSIHSILDKKRKPNS